MKKLTLLVFVSMFLSACATPYKADGIAGGYSESWLSHNAVYVNFQGNGYTSRGRTEAFARLRAVELAIENNFEYIAFVDSNAGGFSMNYQTPSYATTTGAINSYGNYSSISANTTVTGGQNIPIYFPSSGVSAIFMHSKNEYPNVKAIPVELIFEAIKKEYGLSKPVFAEVKNRASTGSGEYLTGYLNNESESDLPFKIETGKRTGNIEIPVNGEVFTGKWVLIARGDSVAEIGGEISSQSGAKGFVKFDVIPGNPPAGVGTFTLESGQHFKAKF